MGKLMVGKLIGGSGLLLWALLRIPKPDVPAPTWIVACLIVVVVPGLVGAALLRSYFQQRGMPMGEPMVGGALLLVMLVQLGEWLNAASKADAPTAPLALTFLLLVVPGLVGLTLLCAILGRERR